MPFMFRTSILLVLSALLLALSVSPGAAQVPIREKPIMQNTFFNVIWGSALGGVLGLASAIISADDASAPDNARSAGFSGSRNGAASTSLQGEVRGEGIYFSIQGNIVASDAVIVDAVAAFLTTEGDVMDRTMAALEASDAAGGSALSPDPQLTSLV